MEQYDQCPRSYEDYRQGTVVPGVVTMIKKYGVLIRLPHLPRIALCPIRMLQDFYVEDIEEVVEVGQTLWAKVPELIH